MVYQIQLRSHGFLLATEVTRDSMSDLALISRTSTIFLKTMFVAL